MFKILGKEELELQQWSSDEMVINPCMNEGDEVVFVNGKGKHIVTQAYRMDGTVVADVPNDFLQQKGNILVYLEQGKNRHHECETVLSVLGCDKPNGYKCKKNEKVFPPNQANWNQNDPTKADYVKNRPFYSEETEVVLLEETNASFTEGAFSVDKITFPDSVLNVRVSWNGVEYNCPALYTSGEFDVIVGNTAVFGGPDTGDPFAIGFWKVGAVIIGADGSETVTTSIVCIKESATEIPKKFLPSDVCLNANEFTMLPFDLCAFGKARCGANWLNCGTIDGVANGMSREAFEELAGYIISGRYSFIDEFAFNVKCHYSENGWIANLNLNGVEYIGIIADEYANVTGESTFAFYHKEYYIVWNTTKDAAYVYYVYYKRDITAPLTTNVT